ncbi:MAG TPA: Rid family hydrolase [Micromonosporaceae bacterium]
MYDVIRGDDLPVLGPYSPAVRAGGLVFVSAQAGIDPSTGDAPATGGFEAECRQALTNLGRVLERAGSDLRHVVRTTVFYTDLADMPAINATFADVFPVSPPARSSALVGLPGGRRISVDAIALAVYPDGLRGETD